MNALLLCFIVGVSDGDTLTARCDTDMGAETIKVRLAEIDAPERAQPFGTRSRQALSALCFQQQATLSPQKKDRYGRTVARIECQGRDASAEQVRAGLAWAFTRYLTDSRIRKLEAEARTDGRGLWVDASPMAPWEWRRDSSQKDLAPIRRPASVD